MVAEIYINWNKYLEDYGVGAVFSVNSYMKKDQGYTKEFRRRLMPLIPYRVFRAQADWTLTHTSHKNTEQSTIEASITLDGVTLTDLLMKWSRNNYLQFAGRYQCLPIRCSGRQKTAQWTLYIICAGNTTDCHSQWPRGLRNKLSSLARTLGSWIRIPLKAWMFVCVCLFCICIVLYVGSGLARSWSLVQGVLPSV
jgi:hypothetical protein